MANIYGFDAYGTDLYTQQGNLFIPRDGFQTGKPREIINFSEMQRSEAIVKQYVKLNSDGLYEVNIPGKPRTVYFNEADALRNCRYQLTNTPAAPVVNTPTGGNAPTGGNQPVNTPANGNQATAQTPLQSKYSKVAIDERVAKYRTAMEQQGLKGQQLEEQVGRYREGLLAERKKHFNKLKGKQISRNIANGKLKVKPKVQPQEVKGAGKIGKFFKGKGGKVALALGAAALIGTIFLSKCSDDTKAEEAKPEETTAPVDETPAEETPVEETPVEETPVEETPATEAPVAETPAEQQPVEEVPAAEQPVAETPAEEPQNEIFQALKGSDYWKYAERELIAEHQGEADYKPTNSEINTRMYEILQRNNASIAADGIHSDPMLMVNDDIQLSKKLTDLLKQAKQQLIEEHNGEAGYEPTYREVAKKMDEIIANN